ncbi:hypothetical protein BANRA_01780 [Klebsiella pneumoniae]|nr:hypothetical protein BANRA_01780 [Klebsiella pneumoniae]
MILIFFQKSCEKYFFEIIGSKNAFNYNPSL